MFMIRCLILAILVLGAMPTHIASAQDAKPAKPFAVLPFAVHGPEKYAYLGDGVRSMLVSRLTWPGKLEPVEQYEINQALPEDALNEEAVRGVMAEVDAEAAVFGSVTVMGEDASLDMTVVDADGTSWPKAVATPVSELIPALEKASEEIGNKMLGIEPEPEPEPTQQAQGAPQAGGIVYEDSRPAAGAIVYSKDGRAQQSLWNTQSMPLAGVGMVVEDGDGDGVNEVFILGEDSISAFHVRERKLEKVSEHEFPSRIEMIRLSATDTDGDALPELIATGVVKHNEPWSVILKYENGEFVVDIDYVDLFLNVVQTPPRYRPQLVGQRQGQSEPFDRSIYEAYRQGDDFELGLEVPLPLNTNVYGFGYMPQPENYLVLVADDLDKLRVYTRQDSKLYVTPEPYANTPISIDYPDKPRTSFGISRNERDGYINFYVPGRIKLAKIHDEDRWEVLTMRNESVVAQIFANFRDFGSSEIHSLNWDGAMVSPSWKTRQIKGATVDFDVDDVDNDGADELAVLVRTSTSGFTGATRSAVMVFELD